MSLDRTRVTDVLDAYLQALEAGRAPSREELLARHPDLAGDLSAMLDGLEFVHRASRECPGAEGGDGAVAGKRLGDYRVLREIGRGGMAVVYEAEQVSLRRRVALKVLPFASVLDARQLQRFKNEALAVAQLRHPHIVPVHGAGSEAGVHYYAMEYVEGQSLDRVIRGMRSPRAGERAATPLSSFASNRDAGYLRMAATLGVQAAEALAHAHHLGVLHRDVKPANLLVDAAGSLWITDFGLARSLRDAGLTLTGELLGTVRYMSPEQAHMRALPIDHRTDVYSLGATLYELVTLQPAFPGEDTRALLVAIANREPTPPRRLNPSLPHDFETVLLKAMSKDPADRYATAQEMADDLRRFLHDEPVRARRPSAAARLGRWSRRHRRVVAASCGLLLLGVAALGVYSIRISREQRKAEAALAGLRAWTGKYVGRIGVVDFRNPPLSSRDRESLEAALPFYPVDSDDPGVLLERAWILKALERYAETVKILDRLIALRNPDDNYLAMIRGNLLQELNRPVEATASYELSIALRPDSARACQVRGYLLERDEKVDEAIQEYRKALTYDPGIPPGIVYRSVGLLLAKKGDHHGAIAEFRKYGPAATPVIRLALGRSLLAVGQVADAIQEFYLSLEEQPGDGAAHADLGLALEYSGELKGAAREYAKAVRLQPGDADLRLYLAHVRSQSVGTPDSAQAASRAEAVLERILRSSPPGRDPRDLVSLAALLHWKGLARASGAMYEAAFLANPALADDVSAGHRYTAACSAGLVAAGGDTDAPEWRARAYAWLRADLAARRDATDERAAVLAIWKRDADLASVRDRVDALPDSEREQWRRFWSDVEVARSAAHQPK